MTIAIIEPFPVLLRGVQVAINRIYTHLKIHESFSWDEFRVHPPVESPKLFIFGIELDSFEECIKTIQSIGAHYPKADVIVLDGAVNAGEKQANRYIHAGAAAYSSKRGTVEDFIDCISTIVEKKTF